MLPPFFHCQELCYLGKSGANVCAKPGTNSLHHLIMTLPESTIQDAFHSYLKSSLTHAKAERLLDPALLESAEADLMVTGPALCLYFAALRCTTNPPSVPLPRSRKGGEGEPIDLSPTNCPPTFIPFLTAWARLVPPIQALPPERQHDLARVICGLSPLYQGEGVGVGVGETAHRLRAIALEISQRRSFQDRFAGDIQAALDGGGGEKRTTSFVPPPGYDSPPPPTPPPRSSPPPSSPEREGNEAILTIRETLYAALGDVLSAHARVLRPLMARDPPRAYFGSVALAVLDVAVGGMVWSASVGEGESVSEGEGRRSMERRSMDGEKEGEREGRMRAIGVRTPLPHTPPLTLEACPPALQPFMRELCGVAEEWRERDDREAVSTANSSNPNSNSNQTTLERVVDLLIQGAYSGGRTSPEGRTLAFANRVSALALGVTRLAAFRERQDEVFGILRAVMG